MNKNNEKIPNSSKKRASRERLYSQFAAQRKMLAKDTKDLRTLNELKGGFTADIDFDLSDVDQIALDKHNTYMETESSNKISSIQGDIRLNAAISRGK